MFTSEKPFQPQFICITIFFRHSSNFVLNESELSESDGYGTIEFHFEWGFN